MGSLHSTIGRCLPLWTLALVGAQMLPPAFSADKLPAERPSVRVTRTMQPPKIDGLLDDAAWKEASQVTDFHLVGTGAAPAEATAAWLASDGQFPGRLIGDPDGPGQDSARPFHGRQALRIANPFDQASGLARAQYIHAFAARGASRGGIPVEVGKTYVFSAYLHRQRVCCGNFASILH